MTSVTVCVPVFNETGYLKTTIRSLLAQTVAFTELLVIDDGSEKPVVVDEPCARVVRLSHRGPQNAYNAGLMLAQGEAFLPIHSDDWLAPTFIERTLARFDGSDVVCPAMQEEELRNSFWQPRPVTLEEAWRENPYPYCALYRTQTLREIGGWHGELHEFPDWGLWIDLLRRGKRFAFAPDAVFHYRVRGDSASSHLTAAIRSEEMRRLHASYAGTP